MNNFLEKRRQPYIDNGSFETTLLHYAALDQQLPELLLRPQSRRRGHASLMMAAATNVWSMLLLRYTGGAAPSELASRLDEVVERFQRYVDKNDEASDDHHVPPFRMVDTIDTYNRYLQLVSVSILLHREDLLPTIFEWNAGTDYDSVDAVLEELFKFFIPNRPRLDTWLWDQPYRELLDAIDEPDPAQRPQCMRKYVRNWYPSMKGKAAFWGQHEHIKANLSPYVGYWAMCAGAFTYLYDIDDSSYRDELVYPKDLVDYARSMPRRPFASPGASTR